MELVPEKDRFGHLIEAIKSGWEIEPPVLKFHLIEMEVHVTRESRNALGRTGSLRRLSAGFGWSQQPQTEQPNDRETDKSI